MRIPFLNKSEKNKVKENPAFLAAIQPQGGISFHERVISKGDGYEAVIHIYDYPSEADNFWLEKIMSIKDVIVTVDVGTKERHEVIREINKSLEEENSRMVEETDKIGQIDAANSFNLLQSIYNDISQQGETMKLIHTRIYAHEKTTTAMEEKVKDIIETLESEGFHGKIFLNEGPYEWQSLFLPYSEQTKMLNRREGHSLPSFSLAGSYPFNFSSLSDPAGTFLGTSFTGGNVIFDMFHADDKRTYYNGVIFGEMGKGKSTTLKKLLLDCAIRNYKVRGFEITGEFRPLIQKLGGRIVSLDGSEGIINPLQVYRTAEKETQSFMLHLSKLSMFFKFLAPDATDVEVKEFEKVLRELYEEKGLTQKIETTGITNLRPEEYPTFTDLLAFVRKELYEDFKTKKIHTELSESRIKRLDKIELTLEDIVKNYGFLFDGHSSIDNLIDEQIVFFSIKSLSNMKKEVFTAQTFNILSMLQDNIIQNGKPQLDAMYRDPDFDLRNVVRFLIIIDEAHRIINSNNLIGVDYLSRLAVEARKYFAGLLFASQSIRDFVPNIDSNSAEVAQAVEKIKKLFELTQYKFIMQQDPNTLQSMRQIFEGQLSDSEINTIPELEKGECILSIKGYGNIALRIEVSEEEKSLFQGGL